MLKRFLLVALVAAAPLSAYTPYTPFSAYNPYGSSPSPEYSSRVAHHPSGHLHVKFTEDPSIVIKDKTEKDPGSHFLNFSNSHFGIMQEEGRLYIKWDAGPADFKAYLNAIAKEIDAIEPKQNFKKKKIIKKDYAVMQGYPWGIVIVHGDGFLVAFALRCKSSFHAGGDANSYIKRVAWWKD